MTAVAVRPAPSLKSATTANATGNPILDLFNGFGFAIRRSFFNQAPKVKPIQISGQTIGVITGTIAAVDPEGDPIEYTLKKAPEFGTVVFGPAGTYTYTPGAGFDGTDQFIVTAKDTGIHINLLSNPFTWFSGRGTRAVAHIDQAFTPPPACTTTCVTFTFKYGEGADWWTPEARAALQAAADSLSSYLVVTNAVNITYDITASDKVVGGNEFGSALGTGSSSYASGDGVFHDTVVGHKIQTGVDLNGQTADGKIWFQTQEPWSFGGTLAADHFDLQSVALHELLHTLGFVSSVQAPGSNPNYGVTRTVWDSYMVTGTSAHPISSDGRWDPRYDYSAIGSVGFIDTGEYLTGGLYFGGANAVAAYGGLIPLNTPGEFEPGSSLSHLAFPGGDSFGGGDAQLVMAPSAVYGRAQKLSPVELGILEDLGYTVIPGYADIVL
ncbi:Ig-like domain-containing protein [Mycobacterium sp. RTGN5]|uniref:Ig-like domain-containing protein n=1 Tax=Mycobacterium sp. RTGN5 TaxID=3016522 RepID=UPI0029C6CF74|nr:Ig-like domain-containing protein [Mycobacterium sp. RTGN5]